MTASPGAKRRREHIDRQFHLDADLGATSSQSIEVNTSGVPTFNESLSTPAYRSFRMTDFYNVPQT